MRSALPWLAVLTACAWDAPTNTNALSAPELPNVLSGVVAYPGDGEPATTFITIYDANNPGPPSGLGSPLTFSAVTTDAYTTDTTGLQSAPWFVGDLQDGDYLVNALMDLDGDFHPFTGVLTGATCGDWIGTHLASLDSTTPAVVSAEGGVEIDDLPVVLGVEVTTERPVFKLATNAEGEPPAISREIGKQSGANILLATQMLYTMEATAVSTALSPELPVDLGPACTPDPAIDCSLTSICPCDLATLQPCDTALWVWMVDADEDGVLDPYPGQTQAEAGFYDVWPRVYIEYTGELPEGERWVSENFPLGFDLAINPDPAQFGPLGVPFPVESLSVLWSPVFRHYWEGGTDGTDASGPFDYVDLRDADVASEDVPAGQYALTVVSFTGQTWTLPNDIGLLDLPSFDDSLDNRSQLGVLTVE